MIQLSREPLEALCDVVFRFYSNSSESVKDLVVSVLKYLDIRIDFINESITYEVDADTTTTIYRKYLNKKGSRYKKYNIFIPDRELEDLEELLTDNSVLAGKMYPIFSFMGYTIRLKEERWRIQKP